MTKPNLEDSKFETCDVRRDNAMGGIHVYILVGLSTVSYMAMAMASMSIKGSKVDYHDVDCLGKAIQGKQFMKQRICYKRKRI